MSKEYNTYVWWLATLSDVVSLLRGFHGISHGGATSFLPRAKNIFFHWTHGPRNLSWHVFWKLITHFRYLYQFLLKMTNYHSIFGHFLFRLSNNSICSNINCMCTNYCRVIYIILNLILQQFASGTVFTWKTYILKSINVMCGTCT
jgi:hypothetical protein